MEPFVMDNGKYTIELLTAATFPGAIKVIRESFCHDEVVDIACEVNKNPLAIEELLELCADAAMDGVSLVAVDVNSGEVVATCFNKLQLAASDTTEKTFFEIFAEERCTQESSKTLIQFMATVDEKCNLFQKYNVDCSFELMFLGTLREHRKQKLAYNLCKISIDVAKKLKSGPVSKITVEDLGPKYSSMQPRSVTSKYPKICQAIMTAVGSMKIAKSLGFTVQLIVPFDEYFYNGKSFAERIGGEPLFCELVAKEL